MSFILTFPRYEAVMDLVAPHFGRNHHVTMDNWFTSPELLQDLRNRGDVTRAIGDTLTE
jgi:hypothetical protein